MFWLTKDKYCNYQIRQRKTENPHAGEPEHIWLFASSFERWCLELNANASMVTISW